MVSGRCRPIIVIAIAAPKVAVQDQHEDQGQESQSAVHDQLVLPQFGLDGVEEFVSDGEFLVYVVWGWY